MRIVHAAPRHTTQCAKMTEERPTKRHGMNGIGSDSADYAKGYGTTPGGRLKFFKDGKFILELERAREGERVSWVSVPRKTFWPPPGTAAAVTATTPTYRQESSTSLSVSDDNSSIQSSPWQRDHSWKQPTPRRNLSKEMSFYYWLPKKRRARRRRHDARRRRWVLLTDDCSIESRAKIYNNRTNGTRKVCGSNQRLTLLDVVRTLGEKASAAGTPPRPETVVSPRKRFLREMEKDRAPIDDGGGQKRSRNKPSKTDSPVRTNGTSSVVCGSGNSNNIGGAGGGVGGDDVAKSAKNCSYSITSLLAEDKNTRRSPSNSPSHFGTSATQQLPYGTTTAEDRWYSESVDRLQSIELSQAEKRGGYPLYPPHHSYVPQYMYPYSLPPYYSPGVYGRGYMIPHVYSTPHTLQSSARPETPSCSWAVEPPRDNEHRDDITDMPLNLSKHAG